MRKANNKKETGSKVILIRFSCLYHSPQVVFMLIRKEIDCNMAFPDSEKNVIFAYFLLINLDLECLNKYNNILSRLTKGNNNAKIF